MQLPTRLGTDEAGHVINQTSRLRGLSSLVLIIHIRENYRWMSRQVLYSSKHGRRMLLTAKLLLSIALITGAILL